MFGFAEGQVQEEDARGGGRVKAFFCDRSRGIYVLSICLLNLDCFLYGYLN